MKARTRSRWIPGLVATGLLVLSLGLALGTTAPTETPPVPTLTVPVGRLGDEAEYTVFRNWTVTRPGNVTVQRDAYKEAYAVGQTAQVSDRWGRTHNAVEVLTGFEDPSVRAWSSEWISLATRSIARSDYAHSYSLAYQHLLEEGIQPPGNAWPHDNLEDFRFFGGCDSLRYSYMGWQAETLVPGASLPTGDAVRPTMCTSSSVGLDWLLSWMTREVQVQHVVGEWGEFRGKPALPIHLRVSVLRDFDHPDTGEVRTDQLWYNQTTWFQEHAAYPVFSETGFRIVIARRGSGEFSVADHHLYRALDTIRTGTGAPIGWGNASSLPKPATSPSLELTRGDQTHPGDGSAPRLAYPLAAALQSLGADTTLRGFREWKSANPDHHLVGGILEQSPGTLQPIRSTNATWTLTFMTPSRATIQVESHQDALGRVVNSAGSPFRALPRWAFDRDDLRTNVATFGNLYRILDDLTRNSQHEGLGYELRWGYEDLPSYPMFIDTFVGDTTDRLYRATLTSRPATTASPLFLAPSVQDGRGLPWQSVSMNLARGSLIGIDRASNGEAVQRGFEVGTLARDFEPPTGGGSEPRYQVPFPILGTAAVVSGSVAIGLLFYLLLAVAREALTKAVVFVPGYAKLGRSKVLNHETRDLLLQAVRANPGISPPHLHRLVGGGWSTVVYHLRVLEKNRLLVSVRDGRHRRFFIPGQFEPSARARVTALQNEKTKVVFETIQERPGINQSQLRARMGLSPPGLEWHLRRLDAAHLIEREKQGRCVLYRTAGAPLSPALSR